MYYEIEQAGPGHEHRPDVGTRRRAGALARGQRLRRRAAPMPLRFDTLEQARTYVIRTLGTLRIVEVTDDGEHLPVDTNTP